MGRLLVVLAALLALTLPGAASAEVRLAFHSFNGSVIAGRYPHTFVVLEGTLEETGERISENHGFTARRITPAILNGPVEHAVMAEKTKYLTSTNRHFTVKISDAQYHRIRQEIAAWRDASGKFYDLDTRNCIHFVGRIAEIAGVKVTYPKALLRKPKAWLNHVTSLNPLLGAKPIR